MKEYTKEELKSIYKERVLKLSINLLSESVGACVFIDNEAHRDPCVSYYSGHPSDAILIVFDDGYSILIPWDEILAKKNAFFDKLVPYTRYKNDEYAAVLAVLNSNQKRFNLPKIELPPYLKYPEYLKFVDTLSNYQCRCVEKGIYQQCVESRLIKDDYEIECTKEAARIGDLIIDSIEEKIRSGEIKTEMDVALLIERECRIHGCEKTGFDTLAAGPERSFAIHAFPGYTNAQWPGEGLSILDFGVVYKGYTSDTTVTVAKGNLSCEQEEQLELVQKAYNECVVLYKKDLPIADAAKRADAIFATKKRKMPHTLGHGIGLEIHEFPRVSSKTDPQLTFQPGMIITCEPGLYDEKLGGCRLENDVLITEDGNEVITHSRIIRI